MGTLIIFSTISWIHTGNQILVQNWRLHLQSTSVSDILRDTFLGICLGFLGVTGIECTPAYIESIRPKDYSAVLTYMIVAATLLNVLLIQLLLSNLPFETLTGSHNLLSLLAQQVSGKWLRYLVVADAMVTLCGGGSRLFAKSPESYRYS
jgi:amino acid transporter